MRFTVKLLRLKLLIFKGSCVKSRVEGGWGKNGDGEVGKEEGLKGGRQSKWKETLDHGCNKKELEKEAERKRRAKCPAAVIRFHLNPWTLNDLLWVETACQRCVCAIMCVRTTEKEKESVSMLTSAVKTLVSPPQHPSVLHPALFTPHLFPYILPPPGHCVTRMASYSSTYFSLSACSFFTGLLCLIWLVYSQRVCHSVVSLTGLPFSPFYVS